MELHLREINPNDIVSKLSLGFPEFTPLKIFLKNSALDFHLNNIAKTYVLVEEVKEKAIVRGYASVMNSEITLEPNQRPSENPNSQQYSVFPAVKIARLAVDKNLHGKGYGRILLDYSITMVKQLVMPYIGCRFLVVDSKPQAVAFYEKAGFILLDSDENKASQNPAMFLDLHNLN